MRYLPAKRAGAVLDYKIDWSADLGQGESIASAVVTATGLTIDNQVHDAASVTVTLSGGAVGTPGVLVCNITTDGTPARTDVETIVLPIGEEPVNLDMAKRQLRLEGTTADDDYLLELIQSAREHVEVYCGIRAAPAALTMTFASFSELERLSAAPVQSIVQVRYLDASGALQTLDPSVYELINVNADELRPRLRLAFGKTWPTTRSVEDAVQVSAVVGYTVVPSTILRAMLLLITDWYDNRSPTAVDVRGTPVELPNRVTALLSNCRR